MMGTRFQAISRIQRPEIMALRFPLSFPLQCFSRRPHVSHGLMSFARVTQDRQCLASNQIHESTAPRPSANYGPSTWDYNFMQSLESDYKAATFESEELQKAVKRLLEETVEPLDLLELIDTIERLGLSFLYETEIKGILNSLSIINKQMEETLYATALRFRLLRQHGYEISPDVFNSFMDERGTFKTSLCDDTKGLLSLYQASHLAIKGETVLDEAKAFTTKHLEGRKGKVGPHLERQIDHALELPLHWRMPRLEARWSIDHYHEEKGMNPILLKLAKLEFNRVQSIHQSNLREASRWWMDLRLGVNLSFARDRLMECFYWALGMSFEPQFGYFRETLAKVNQFITTIDDIYDVYGSLDELELFTEAVDRWDAKAIDQLPDYMKMCFLALYNTVNKIAYDILEDQGLNIIPYLSKVWADFCKSMLMEARWSKARYQPTLQEYLDNAWISSSVGVMLVHGLFSSKQRITPEALDCVVDYPNLIRWPALILRLSNDLATSKDELERGDVSSSIQCYISDANVPEWAAREHIRALISNTWKEMNKEYGTQSPFPLPFVKMAMNLARTAQCVYQYGDGHTNPDSKTKSKIQSLLVDPIILDDKQEQLQLH